MSSRESSPERKPKVKSSKSKTRNNKSSRKSKNNKDAETSEDNDQLTLSSLLPSYPDLDDPELASKIASLHEFRILQSAHTEKSDNSTLYNHQQANARILNPLTPYEKLIILDDPGMGKTITAASCVEQHKPYLEKGKRALVLVTNKKVADNFNDTLSNKINPVLYGELSITGHELERRKGKKRVRTKRVRNFYDIQHFNQFFDEIRRHYNEDTMELDEDFIELYSDTVIVIDEAHHIKATKEAEGSKRSRQDDSDKGKLGAVTVEAIEKQLRRIEPDADIDYSTILRWLSGKIRQSYLAFFLFMHSVRNSKVIIMTATPMVNYEEEIAHLLNLILPPSKHVLPSEIRRLHGDALRDYLAPSMVGYISYARAKYTVSRLDKGENIVAPDENGDDIVWQTKIVSCKMTDDHYEALKRAMTERGDNIDVRNLTTVVTEEEEGRKREEESFAIRSRNASNFLFPIADDGKLKFVPGNYVHKGKKVFELYITRSGSKKSKDNKGDTGNYDLTDLGHKVLLPWITDRKKLERISPKFAYILTLLEEEEKGYLPNQKKVNRRYPTYIYEPLVHGSGAILLSVILRYNGYELYTGKVDPSFHGILPEKIVKGGVIKYRIALILGDTEQPQVEQIRDVFNDPKNANGERLLAVIGSQTSGESISLTNARRIVLCSPFWHESSMTQVIGRGFRIEGTLKYFQPLAGKEKLIEVYKLAATYRGEVTTDLYIYMLAETKDKRIGSTMRIARQCSITGIVNKALNTHPEDVEGSRDADYTVPDYDIISGDITISGRKIKSKPDNRHNYDVYYDKDRTQITRRILEILRIYPSIHIIDLVSMLQDYPFNTVLFAIDLLLSNRDSMLDTFGFMQYVKHDNGYLFLQPEYGNADPELQYYASHKYYTFKRSTESLYIDASADLISQFIDSIPYDIDELNTRFTKLHGIIKSRIAILYEGLIDGTIEVSKKQRKALMDRFSGQIWEDTDDGKLYHKMYYVGKKQRNKDKSYALTVTRLNKVCENRVIKPSKIRVYIKETNLWRYATIDEDEIVINAFNNMYKEQIIKMARSNTVYGILFRLGMEFKVYLPKSLKKEKSKGVQKKKRKSKKGDSSNESDKKGGKKGICNIDDIEAEEVKSIRNATRGRELKNKSESIYCLWLLYKNEDIENYPFPNYDPSTLDVDREIAIMSREDNDRKGSKRKYDPSETGIALEDMSDEMLYFFSYFLIDYTNGSIDKTDTIIYYIYQRLLELGQMVYR